MLAIVHVIDQLLHELKKLGLEYQSLSVLIVPKALNIAVLHPAAFEYLGVADVLLLDDPRKLLEECLHLRVCSFEVGGALTLVAAVVFLLDET